MSKTQDTYPLRAPKGDLDRWRNTARKRGVPFSQHVREALEAAERKTAVRVELAGGGGSGGIDAAKRHAQAREATERATGRTFRPDFKKGMQ